MTEPRVNRKKAQPVKLILHALPWIAVVAAAISYVYAIVATRHVRQEMEEAFCARGAPKTHQTAISGGESDHKGSTK